MPVEIELLNINASSLERVLEANLTNLFGTSSDDFLSFKQEKNSETYFKKLCIGEWLISPHGSPTLL